MDFPKKKISENCAIFSGDVLLALGGLVFLWFSYDHLAGILENHRLANALISMNSLDFFKKNCHQNQPSSGSSMGKKNNETQEISTSTQLESLEKGGSRIEMNGKNHCYHGFFCCGIRIPKLRDKKFVPPFVKLVEKNNVHPLKKLQKVVQLGFCCSKTIRGTKLPRKSCSHHRLEVKTWVWRCDKSGGGAVGHLQTNPKVFGYTPENSWHWEIS